VKSDGAWWWSARPAASRAAAYTGNSSLKGPVKVKGRIEMEQLRKGRGLTRACKALLHN
jgi:hypothetical protein